MKFLNLNSIEDRLRRGDMILMFRIMKKDLDIRRGHNLKVNRGKPANLEIRRRFYSQRVAVPWNELPQHIVECDLVDSFKMNYDRWCGKVSC